MFPASPPSSKTTDPLRDLSLSLWSDTTGFHFYCFGISVVLQPCNRNLGNPAPDSFSPTYEFSLNRSPRPIWGPEVTRGTLCLWKEMELAACGEALCVGKSQEGRIPAGIQGVRDVLSSSFKACRRFLSCT